MQRRAKLVMPFLCLLDLHYLNQNWEPTQVIHAPLSPPKASCHAGSRAWKYSSGWKKVATASALTNLKTMAMNTTSLVSALWSSGWYGRSEGVAVSVTVVLSVLVDMVLLSEWPKMRLQQRRGGIRRKGLALNNTFEQRKGKEEAEDDLSWGIGIYLIRIQAARLTP